MMVFRIRDISFTWQTEGRAGVSSWHLPPHPDSAPPFTGPINLVSDVIPQFHQDLVEEGELGDQGLGLLPCQGAGCRKAQNWGTSPDPSLGNKPVLPPLPTPHL